MEQQNEISRIGIQIGDDFEGDGKRFVKVDLTINQQQAQISRQKILTDSQQNIDSDWSAVLVINTAPQNTQNITDLINKLTTQDPDNTSDMHAGIRELIADGQLTIKHFESNGKFFIQVSPQQDTLGELQAMITPFMEGGIKEVAQTQLNSFKINLCSNISNDDFMQYLESGERLGAALLQPTRLEIEASLSKDLPDKVKEVVSNFDESLASSPPIMFLKYFKNIDIDLRFDSANELPDFIRKNVLFGKELQKCSPQDRKIKEDMDSCLNVILDNLESDVEIILTVPDFLSVHAQGHAPSMSNFFKEYGNFVIGN